MNRQYSPDVPELIETLANWYRLLRDTPVHGGNSIDAVRGVIHNVLALSRKIEVQSLPPGDERDLIYKLQLQCQYVDALNRPQTATEIIQGESKEAIEQLCYLLELVSIPWATAAEALCCP